MQNEVSSKYLFSKIIKINLLKRISIKYLNKVIKENSKWKILDIGCGYRAHPSASVIADVQDLSNYYKEKKFII